MRIEGCDGFGVSLLAMVGFASRSISRMHETDFQLCYLALLQHFMIVSTSSVIRAIITP